MLSEISQRKVLILFEFTNMWNQNKLHVASWEDNFRTCLLHF